MLLKFCFALCLAGCACAVLLCLLVCRRLCDAEDRIESLEGRTRLHFEHLSVLWRERQKRAAEKTENNENNETPEA